MDENLLIAVIASGSGILGTIVGSFSAYFLEKRRSNLQLLFEERISLYGKILGQIRTAISSGYLHCFEKLEGIDDLLSEAALVASKDLSSKLLEIGENIYDYRKSYNQINPADSFNILAPILASKTSVLHNLMRDELNPRRKNNYLVRIKEKWKKA